MTLTNDPGSLVVTTPHGNQIVLTRVFDAPRQLVFDALTRPELIVRWYGRRDWSLVTCEVDLRVGGAWRFVSRGPDGTEMGQFGEFREISPPGRLVRTEAFDEWDAGAAVVTTVLVEHDGKTTMTATVVYPSRQVRDAVVETNMEAGAGESYERLDAVLAVAVVADRYRKVVDQFLDRVRAVPAGAWDNPTPCEGWVARDIVRHLTEWLPAFFFGTWGIEPAVGPSVDADPAGAWQVVDDAIRAALDDAEIAGRVHETPMGPSTFAQALDMICTADILIHTWDLARSTGLDETLDTVEVHRMLQGIEPMDEPMRQSGQYGPRVEVADDADEQSQLLAFMGRHP
jgi:uncharacterized protein (TIGR03086 family)